LPELDSLEKSLSAHLTSQVHSSWVLLLLNPEYGQKPVNTDYHSGFEVDGRCKEFPANANSQLAFITTLQLK
jgi:hypothetical protein